MRQLGSTKTSSIDLVVGPYRSGKTSLALQELLEHVKANPFEPSLVVVPSSRYRVLTREKIQSTLQNGIFGLQILTFDEVCKMVLDAQGTSYRTLPKALRPVLISRVLHEMAQKGDLKYLSPIRNFAGTHSALLELIDSFQKTALAPFDVQAKLKASASKDSYHLEIARVYQNYFHELDRIGYLDSKRIAFLAREILHSGVNNLRYGFFLVDCFDRLNPLQIQIFEGLARLSTKACIIFDYEDGEQFQKEYQWKEENYKDLVTLLNPKITYANRSHYDYAPSVETSSFSDRIAEIEATAWRLKEAIVREKRQPDELLVVARHIKPYVQAIDAIFTSAGLPYYLDYTRQLSSLPLVQFLLQLVNLSPSEFSRKNLIACLRSRYFNREGLGLTASDVDQIDDGSLKYRLVSGRTVWHHYFRDQDATDQADAINKLFDQVNHPTDDLSAQGFCLWLENLLQAFLVVPNDLESDMSESDALVLHDDRLAVVQVRGILRSLIQEETILGEEKRPFGFWLGHFERALEKANLRRPQLAQNVICVCDAELAPSKRFDQVHILGLNEGEFPQLSSQPAFMRQDDLASWNSFQIKIDNPRAHPGFEWALYKSLTDRARHRLFLSFPHTEIIGQELMPSFFLTAGKSEAEANIAFLDPYHQSFNAPLSPHNAFVAKLWLESKVSTDLEFPQSKLLADFWQRLRNIVNGGYGRVFSGVQSLYNGYLTDLVHAKALVVEMPPHWSASRLSDYGKCPFRFWTQHHLGLEPREEPATGLNAKQLGQAYHYILEKFYLGLVAQGASLAAIDPAKFEEIFAQSLEQGWRFLQARPGFQPGPLWEYEKHDIKFRLRRFFEKEKMRLLENQYGVVPSGFEVSFGRTSPESFAPLTLKFPERTVTVAGVIDRLDLPPNITFSQVGGASAGGIVVNIIDYKSGQTAISLKEAYAGRNIQLPLYALAVERSILPGSKVTEMHYLSIGSGDSVGSIDLNDEKTRDLLQKVEEHVHQFTNGIAAGDFRVEPSNVKVCISCPQKKVCRIQELSFAGESEYASSEDSQDE
jgi:ATP-dependent helicase/DNAse subunit B